MCEATHKKEFGLRLKAINEVRKSIDYILDDKYCFFYRCLSDLCIEALTGYVNMT